MSQNVLITGITGMVGQHFAASFRKDGYQVWESPDFPHPAGMRPYRTLP